MKFRAGIQGRRKVFVSFQHNKIIRLRKPYHSIKTLELGPDHKIHIPVPVVHHVEDHRGNRRLPVASSNYNTGFILCLLIEEFRIGIYRKTEFPCPCQFRIVTLGVHPEDYSIQAGVDLIGKPPFRPGQDSRGFKT